jgi:gamma-aminobutyric acid type B receptor
MHQAVISLLSALYILLYRLIKLVSSQLNYLIGVGAIILYLNSVLLVIPSIDPNVVTILCNITPCLMAIGFSLCYGTILAKMTRVYYIFNNPTANKKVGTLKSVIDWSYNNSDSLIKARVNSRDKFYQAFL